MDIGIKMVIFSSVIVLALGLFLLAKGSRPRLDTSDIETSLPKTYSIKGFRFLA